MINFGVVNLLIFLLFVSDYLTGFDFLAVIGSLGLPFYVGVVHLPIFFFFIGNRLSGFAFSCG